MTQQAARFDNDGAQFTLGVRVLVDGSSEVRPHFCFTPLPGAPCRLWALQDRPDLVPANADQLGAVVRCNCGRYWHAIEAGNAVWWQQITAGKARRLERRATRPRTTRPGPW